MTKRTRENAVYITQLPQDITEEKLGGLFGSIGIIKGGGGQKITLEKLQNLIGSCFSQIRKHAIKTRVCPTYHRSLNTSSASRSMYKTSNLCKSVSRHAHLRNESVWRERSWGLRDLLRSLPSPAPRTVHKGLIH